jgi:hypothetical protein
MKYAAFILICMVLGSCLNDGNCLITATNNMHLKFKTHRDNKTDTAIALTTILISGTVPDSVLKINATTSEILLPVDIHRDTTTFILQYTSAPSDTLQVTYSKQSKVIAKDCGAFTYYQNLRILHTSFKETQVKEFSTSLLTDPTLYVAASPNYQAYAVNYQISY